MILGSSMVIFAAFCSSQCSDGTTRKSAKLSCMLSLRSVLVLLLLVVSSPSMAAPHWRLLGPHRENLRPVSALAFDPSRPNRVFAGFAGGGIARSSDGGQTWRLMSNGLTGITIHSIAVHPRLGQLVFAHGGYLFRSLDAGRTWTPLPLQEDIISLALNPRNPAVVWAGTLRGLFRSRDFGQTWEHIQANLPPGYGIFLLAADHLDPRRLYIQTFGPGSGFWTSGNGGHSWVRRATSAWIVEIYTDLHTAQTVYVRAGSSRILRSRDAGQTWETFLTIPEHYAEGPMAGDPRDPSTFFVPLSNIYDRAATLYRTTDAGQHWRPLTRLHTQFLEPAALAVGGGGTVLLAGKDNDFVVFRSVNAGDDWDLVARGYPSLDIKTVTVTGSGGLLAGIGGGVERSLDGGATWTTSLPLASNCLVRDLQDLETIYACTPHPFPPGGILWKTVDGGASWIPLPNPFASDADAQDLAIDPADPQTLYLVAGQGLYRSRDGGQTWEDIGEPDIYYQSVTVHAGAPGTILARAQYSGIYRSTDHGGTWTRVMEREENSSIGFVDFSPADADIVYAVAGNILFRSDDGGATFASLDQKVRWPLALALDPLDPDTVLYVAPEERAPVRLTLGQAPEVIQEEPLGGAIGILAFDPNDPHRLLAGTAAGLMEYRFEASP